VFFLLGSANGLLPCGMVYIALLATISFSEVGKSVGFMAAFGAGTLPAMMMAAFAIQKLKWETRKMLRKAVPFFVVVVGLLLILRGLNLGIAFISPEFPKGQEQVVNCHP
jgi:sulfite exporter TauE/SafE